MKEGIHPNYREVLFVDLSNGFKFVTRSCVNTKETETFEGKDYPLFKLDTSSESHPFYTGQGFAARQTLAQAGGDLLLAHLVPQRFHARGRAAVAPACQGGKASHHGSAQACARGGHAARREA